MDVEYSGLIFQGKNSRDLGFTVQYPFNLVHPTADLDATHIKGRSGDFLQDDNSYQNVTETFTVDAVRPSNVSQFDYERTLTDWLASPVTMTQRKYQYLQFDADPEYAYSAIQKDPFSLQWDESDPYHATGTIPFYCEPFQYRADGIEYIPLPDTGTVYNQESRIAVPNWHFIANGTFILYVNGLPYEFDNMSGEFWLSGDTQDTYDKDNKFYNNQVKMPNLSVPTLQPGKNTITITAESGGTITKAEYMPRWRRLI